MCVCVCGTGQRLGFEGKEVAGFEASKFIAGAAAAGTATSVVHPIDTVRTRMIGQVDKKVRRFFGAPRRCVGCLVL